MALFADDRRGDFSRTAASRRHVPLILSPPRCPTTDSQPAIGHRRVAGDSLCVPHGTKAACRVSHTIEPCHFIEQDGVADPGTAQPTLFRRMPARPYLAR